MFISDEEFNKMQLSTSKKFISDNELSSMGTQQVQPVQSQEKIDYKKSGDDLMGIAKNTLDPQKKEQYINLAQKQYEQASAEIHKTQSSFLEGQFSSEGKTPGQNFNIGVAKGGLSTLDGMAKIGHSFMDPIANRALGAIGIDAKPTPFVGLPETITKPDGTAQSIGHGTEQIGEFFIPGGLITKGAKIMQAGIAATKIAQTTPIIGKTLTLAGKAGLGAAEFAGVTAIQSGGDKEKTESAAKLGAAFPVGGAILGKAIRALGSGSEKTAQMIERVNLRLTPTQKKDLGKKLDDITAFLTNQGITGGPQERFIKVKELYEAAEVKFSDFIKKHAPNIQANTDDIIAQIENITGKYKNDRDIIAIEKQVEEFVSLLKTRHPGQISLDALNELKRSTFKGAFNKAGQKVLDSVEFEIGGILNKNLQKITEGLNIAGQDIKSFNKGYGTLIESKKLLDIAQTRPELGLVGKLISASIGGSIGTAIGGPVGTAVGILAGQQGGKLLAGTAMRSQAERVLMKFSKLYKLSESEVGSIKNFLFGGESKKINLTPKEQNIADEITNFIDNPSAVKKTILDKTKNMPMGLSLKDVSGGKAGYEGVEKTLASAPTYTPGPLTTKLLKKLEGRSTVSKTFISDLTNAPDLKQTEKDVIRQVLQSEGDKINVADFGKKVEAELLPLKVLKDGKERAIGGNKKPRYEGISLPSELRGEVKNYSEHIYESPVKTSAGSTHFGGDTNNYFGHTRVEDLPDNRTRRVIEVQSDLYQKGRLEKEVMPLDEKAFPDYANVPDKEGNFNIKLSDRQKEVAKLEQYNNPTAHFRMVREEIKRAADDGVEKVQFPTGETGMKIEGLGDSTFWTGNFNNQPNMTGVWDHLSNDNLKTGLEVFNGNSKWIITDVLGDGKFKAVPKSELNKFDKDPLKAIKKLSNVTLVSGEGNRNWLAQMTESFDISGKVDQNNPIYKFYEKELGRYLKNNFDAKLVTDKQGVNWMEVTVKPEHKGPVTAFGASNLAGMTTGMTTILGLGVAANVNPKRITVERKKERTIIDQPFITERRDGAATSKNEDLLNELLNKYTIKKPVANKTKTKTIIDGIDIAPYATDKEHELKIKQHMKAFEGIDTPEKINAEIERISTLSKKESIIKGMGDTIIKITKHYNIPLTLFLAVLKQDTSLGINNLSKNNPGNIGNDGKKKVDYDTVEEGLVSAARYLANNKS